CQIYSNSPFTF
nr:immunoglobulin light chain junction region [Macaca mulatta]